jgi:uncharacterized protein (DUF1778 family)
MDRKESALELRVKELEAALTRERAIAAAERSRADFLEAAARRAYQMVCAHPPAREHTTEDGGS